MATTSHVLEQESVTVDHSDQQALDGKRPQFGNRYLTDSQNVFQHNAWDNVKWDDSLEQEAKSKVLENSHVVLDKDLQEKYEREANQFWDGFYEIHQNRFFKDRHWLFTEFPELAPNLQSAPIRVYPNNESIEKTFSELNINGLACTYTDNNFQNEYPGSRATFRFLEIGCGVGNTVFPILETNNDPDTFIYCCDFSKTAIEIVTQHPLYDTKRCHAFVCDISSEVWETPFPEGSLDIIILIFVLSAIEPKKIQNVANSVSKYLKPGGLVVLRDYGRYDMAQLRFKPGRCLADNFYVRGDGTRVYFFAPEEIKNLFTQAGLCEEQALIDRRLQVNRGKQLKMYRVWIQCKFRKPLS